MGENKRVVWFTDDKKLNRFFFQSPFRSWKFLVNTALVVLLSLAYLLIVCRYWVQLNRNSFPYWETLLTLLILMVITPYGWALRRHGAINKLYREGKLTEQSADSPLNDILEAADNAINEGLRNTSVLFGIFLLSDVLWRLERFRYLQHVLSARFRSRPIGVAIGNWRTAPGFEQFASQRATV